MKLEKPEMEIVEFEAEDIICTSGCENFGSESCEKVCARADTK